MTTLRIIILLLFLIPHSVFSQYSDSHTDSLAKIVYRNNRFYEVENFSSPKQDNTKVKNIIFLIGDGMGVSQVYGALVANKGNLYMKNMPVTGFSITYSSDNLITDSAAGGTALSTGKKTKNGVIGMDSTFKAQKTILELAEKKGLTTGLVATSKITHATPASFIAHQPDREMHDEIALDFLDTDIDVFIGGGRNYFSKNEKKQNLLTKLQKKGYDIIMHPDSLTYYSGDKLAGLLYPEDAPPYVDGRGDMLPISTKTALNVLSKNQKGFFLMVEGSQIDWGCHNNNTSYTVTEVLDFDRALGEALKFAAEDGQTLVVVTADHETGGFSVSGGSMEKGIVVGKFSTDSHTATMVPVFAFGPGSELFTGIQDNTEIFFKLKELLEH